LLRMYWRLGKVRELLAVGANERKRGRVPSSVFGGDAFPKSYSSQEYVSASPSESVALPTSMNGVFEGIVKLLRADMAGGWFPVVVGAAQFPDPAA
jgi:hypothetical protein